MISLYLATKYEGVDVTRILVIIQLYRNVSLIPLFWLRIPGSNMRPHS